jgi:H-NS histone family
MEWREMAALKSMSVAKLTDLKEKVEAAIAEMIKTRRSELETELSELERHDPSGKRAKARGRGGRRGPVAPKYRNPKGRVEMWRGGCRSDISVAALFRAAVP